jgi:type I restriction enzyme M protein
MREVRVGSLVDYIGLIEEIGVGATCFRGAKDPVEDMRPTLARSWHRNRRIRAHLGQEPRFDLWRYEARLIEAFQRRSLPLLEFVPDCHLSWLAVAQHYQLPTRLLDWSRNPLVALYFAVTDRNRQEHADDWADASVFVWQLGTAPDVDDYVLPLHRVRAMHAFEGGLVGDGQGPAPAGIVLFSPPMISMRFASQEGLFSFEQEVSDRPFTEAALERGLDLTRVVLPGACRLAILRQLSRLGVETEKLFPDLPGLCAHQRWVAEWLW